MIRSKIRKINPERSNKMIFAVAGGLAVVLLAFFSLIIISGRRGGGHESMARTLAYLKNTEGLVAIQALDAEQRAVIVYNSDSKNAGNFKKIAYYAALRLSRHWPDCEVQLARNLTTQIEYVVQIKEGAIVNEGPITTRINQP
jgi:hypothetical protein